ncbi:DUF341 domain protein [Talaromyces proteolyticus]|uniref:DUF341 domain protein n=1 Tax=Talaromyces proteolyticus TaxID=1131652 RepID=A0AAD4KMZ3_9EURO|nr:DUF341 domain protein [Talaromyces proteolyticus]KAH8695169.1 DUF341 domain protein [Talaromyces proteolyticus]
MHFLCFHGIGTNSHVLETQTATIRYEMDRHHTFEFVEGTHIVPIAPEINGYFPSADTYFSYYGNSADSISLALSQLERYIDEEGPFDGVIAFSQGAVLLSTYLIKLSQERPDKPLPFRCAIFFSSSRPFDPRLLAKGQAAWIEPDDKGPLLNLATTHIWGTNDIQQEDARVLCSMCDESLRYVYVHEQGHEIPGARAKEDIQGCVRAIRRAIENGSTDR